MSHGQKHRATELLEDLADQVCSLMTQKLKLNKAQAKEIGQDVADHIASHWGGQSLYIPQGLSSKLSKRDLEIYAKFNGTNHNQLAKEYHVSVVWIYALVKRVHQEEVRKKQGDLF